MARDRQLQNVLINEIAVGGVAIQAQQALPVGADVNLEFNVKYRGENERIRAKTKVLYCRIQSGSKGVVLELKIVFCAKEEMHVFNNILQIFTNAKEFKLQKK